MQEKAGHHLLLFYHISPNSRLGTIIDVTNWVTHRMFNTN